jgi:hypothetical protein
MKPFRNYIINNCNCSGTDYKDYILVYISYKLFDKIIELFNLIQLFNLDQTMLIENEI